MTTTKLDLLDRLEQEGIQLEAVSEFEVAVYKTGTPIGNFEVHIHNTPVLTYVLDGLPGLPVNAQSKDLIQQLYSTYGGFDYPEENQVEHQYRNTTR